MIVLGMTDRVQTVILLVRLSKRLAESVRRVQLCQVLHCSVLWRKLSTNDPGADLV